MNNTEHDPRIKAIGPPCVFWVERIVDTTGVSGTGIVAEGCVFSDGTTVVRWRTKNRSTSVYESARQVQAIHGHDGKTLIRYAGREGVDALACSNCAHAWGDHVADNAGICIAGGCSCCLMENSKFYPVGK